jgi:hypothetical protein
MRILKKNPTILKDTNPSLIALVVFTMRLVASVYPEQK